MTGKSDDSELKKEKNFDTIIVFLKRFFIFLILFVFSVLTTGTFKDWFTFLTFCYALIMELVILIKIENWLSSKRALKKSKSDSLYAWMDGLEGAQSLFIEQFSKRESKDVMTNLVEVKNKLLVLCNHELIKLRILRAYLNTILNDKSNYFYLAVINGFFVTLTGFLIQQLLKSEISLFKGFIFEVTPFKLFFLLIILLAYNTAEMYRDRNRLMLIKEILDACIEEIKEMKT